MSEQIVRKCDECGALHGEVNNWWVALNDPKEPTFTTFTAADRYTAVAKQEQTSLFRLDYCSHKCVGTAFNRWLDTGSVIEVKPKHEEIHESEVVEHDSPTYVYTGPLTSK